MDNSSTFPDWIAEREKWRAQREAELKEERLAFDRLMNRVITYTALGFVSLLVFLWSVLYFLSR